MKLEDTREAYYTATGKLSDICRQLAFGGLAVVWIFKTEKPSAGVAFSVPAELVAPSFWMMATLALDMLQYLSQSLLWWWFDRSMEKEIAAKRMRKQAAKEAVGEDFDNQQVFEAPTKINWLPIGFFYAKVATLTYGYYCLLTFLGKAVWHY